MKARLSLRYVRAAKAPASPVARPVVAARVREEFQVRGDGRHWAARPHSEGIAERPPSVARQRGRLRDRAEGLARLAINEEPDIHVAIGKALKVALLHLIE